MKSETLVATTGLPRVNLLPSEIAEARRMRRIQLGMGGAVVVALLAVGGLWYVEHGAVANAQAAVDTANQQNALLQGQIGKYANVTELKNTVTAMQAQLNQATAQEAKLSTFLGSMAVSLPNSSWLTHLTVTIGNANGAPASTTPSTTTGSQPVGSLTMVGSALNHDGVDALLRTLGAQKGIANPYFTTSTETQVPNTTKTTANFTVTADLTNGIFDTTSAGTGG